MRDLDSEMTDRGIRCRVWGYGVGFRVQGPGGFGVWKPGCSACIDMPRQTPSGDSRVLKAGCEGNTAQRFQDFHLRANARIWS